MALKLAFFLLTGLLFLAFKNQAQVVIDFDGNSYDTVQIGNQIWLKQNLRSTHYNDGTVIPNITDSSTWVNLTSAAYCDYNNEPDSSLIYGRLYNWYTVDTTTNGGKNPCPCGWHVPTDVEWNIMEIYLDSTVDTTASGWVGTDIGRKLKETGTTHWMFDNSTTNSSRFTALPGGFRNLDGDFFYIQQVGLWWTTTEYPYPPYAWDRELTLLDSAISRSTDEKVFGSSVRCLMDPITTDIKEINNNDIQIYPNPAKNKLTIESLQKSIIKIVNIQGQTVMQKQVQQGKTDINISGLAKGVYILRLYSNDKIEVTRIIKE